MRWEAGVGGDLVIVPHAQRAPTHASRVDVFAEGKVVPGLQPAMVRGGELVEWSAFDHCHHPASDPCSAPEVWTKAQVENRNYRN
jgi:hypothetical protein